MKSRLIIFVLFGMTAFAQQPPKPAPLLSTADKVAIQALEKQKSDNQAQWQQAQQAEMAIEQEFATQHPGYHINPQTFAVEKDAKPVPAEKK